MHVDRYFIAPMLIVMSIVYRVHWLRAKALSDRCTEEIELLMKECQWTEMFFHWQASARRHQAQEASEKGRRGPSAYWEKQATLYSRLANAAAQCRNYMDSKDV